MQETLTLAGQAVLLGTGATLVMDLWALLQKQLFTIPSLDYRLVGRWLGHMRHGTFSHCTILHAAPVRGEVAVGWVAHYLTGIIFSALLIALVGPQWLSAPTFLPALLMGIVSVVAPYCLMQPAFGFGFAAANTPAPWTVRWRSLVAHTSFGIGIWLTALLMSQN